MVFKTLDARLCGHDERKFSVLAMKNFFDPLRAFALLNISGDICLLASGVVYDNYVRMAPPVLGVFASLIALKGINSKLFGYSVSRLTMAMVAVAGLLFMFSGSNLHGFEVAPRLGEGASGALIFAGCLLNLFKKPALGAACFVLASVSMAGASFEPWWHGGQYDIWMMLSFVCFLSSNILTKWIR